MAGGGVLAVAGALAVLVLAGVLVLSGVVPWPGSASTSRPSCGSLPTTSEVETALADHPEVTKGLTSTAHDVHISVDSPCSGNLANRSMIRISVSGGSSREAVTEWLNTHDGYGVPVNIR